MDSCCLVCFDTIEKHNAVEYKMGDSEKWFTSLFCVDCILMLQKSQFKKYCNDLATTTCAKEQRKLLERGPPTNIYDKNGFPESQGEEVFMLRRASDMTEFSPKLVDALEGDARMQFWEQQKQFIIEHEDLSLTREDGSSESTLDTLR